MNEKERAKFKEETRDGFQAFCNYLNDEKVDLLLADEMLGVVENGFVSEDELVNALKNKKPNVEVALSGRKTFPSLIEVANLVSTIDATKHYFDEGVPAREGIEY
ncbi:hypothetical protein Zmor_016454 [Zophobas morio]|uniref:Uncharacterized protein n=1 Tax=Zophobas morio TaxID=2755281 RepID=A0AA38HKR4_9CUCU|nr:hypothetical protein Zmor_016454 [Zophobas morio]